MSGTEKTKILVDIALCVLLVFCMGFQFWGTLVHEVAGTLMLLCFMLHNILNRRWYMSLFKGRYSWLRLVFTISVALVFADMLVMAYTSMVISHYVFSFLPKFGSMAQAHRLHLWGSYLGMVLMSLHLGMHWTKFVPIANVFRLINLPRTLLVILPKLVACAIASYGVYVFVRNDCWEYLLLKRHFAEVDNAMSAGVFYVDYFAMLGAGVFLAHYAIKFFKTIGRG